MQKNNINILPMQKRHVAGMAQLEKLCFSAPWSEAMLCEEMENKCARYLIAECDTTLCGYVGLHRVLDEGYITNVAVSPQFRRQGVARHLIETIIAQEHDLSFVTLEVRVGNVPAISLYKSLGFSEVGIRKNYYTKPCEDACLMTKWLCEMESR